MSIIGPMQSFLVRNSTKIITGVGIIASGAAIVIAVKETPKALELIKKKKEELKVDKLTVPQTIKTTWKCYVGPAALELSAIGCFVGLNLVNSARYSELLTKYTTLAAESALAESAHQIYREEVAEKIGEDEERDISKKADERIVEKTIQQNPQMIFVGGSGEQWFMDPISKHLFKSTTIKVEGAINRINFKMRNENYVPLSEWWYETGLLSLLSGTELGEELGWNVDGGCIELNGYEPIAYEDESHGTISVLVPIFNHKPKRGYDDLH